MQTLVSYGRLLSRAIANGVFSVSSSGSASSSVPNSQQQSVSNSSPSTSSICQSARKRIRLLTAVSGFPKNQGPDRVRPGKFGDDAYFVARHQLGEVIGVADGVGGWRAWGIDPGEFSHTLMQSCERLVSSSTFSPTAPTALLAKAYAELEHSKHHILGSSTACLVMVRGTSCSKSSSNSNGTSDHDSTCSSSREQEHSRGGEREAAVSGILSSANIGDSGYLVVRGGHVVHRSHEQQHYFNTPFQLSLPPPGTSGHVLSDSPSSADTREFEVEAGDILLVATDGVFDNLPVPNILQLLQQVEGTSDLADLQTAANLIAQQARQHAFDEDYMSPFALSAIKNGINTRGGKPDDITVILAAVLG
uniref:Protein phosphatase n=1 Tax=Hirondellea gigas TaxID=1518452 RepID=A0A2P2HYR4_9CRUS